MRSERPDTPEAAPGGGSAPLRWAIVAAGGGRRDDPVEVEGQCGRRGSPSVATEPAGLLHPAQEQQLVDLLERPVAGRTSGDRR